jgi:NADP-dependent aldehyde dehydrogenase
MMEIARCLEGSLTATIHGTRQDFEANRPLLAVLARKAGRLIFDGFPTGVEVCTSMQHGGPYPATSDSRFTSVGTAAIQRFSRPVCFQDCPVEFLPSELQALSK